MPIVKIVPMPGPQGPSGTGQGGDTGDITFEGNSIIGNGTINLVPNADLLTNEYSQTQYLIIDPTAPNHIHIRAGGNIDESTAELILGGERNKVSVSDLYKSVAINTAATITNTYVNAHEANTEDLIVPDASDILIGDNIVVAGVGYPVTYFSPDPNNTGFSIVRATGLTFIAGESYTFVREEPYEHSWQFNSNGVLSGPAMGGVRVPAIANTGPDDDLYIYAYGANADLRLEADQDIRLATEYGDIVLNPDGGAYIRSASPENEIATLGDIGVETEFQVVGGTTGTQPTFNGNPLFFGNYIRMSNNLVHFDIQVDFDNITSFGTGQYYVDLPFPAKYEIALRDGCVHDVGGTTKNYHISGQVAAGSDRLYLFTSIKEGNNVEDVPFTATSVFALSTADKFHIAGMYIAEVAP